MLTGGQEDTAKYTHFLLENQWDHSDIPITSSSSQNPRSVGSLAE